MEKKLILDAECLPLMRDRDARSSPTKSGMRFKMERTGVSQREGGETEAEEGMKASWI